jgi:2-succinyl-6-hydroxy-2,4-cyclohexadiene-1-carboxylate synthase
MTPTPPSPTTPPPTPATWLHAEVVGNGPRLLLAHGFTQTGTIWGSMDDRLADGHQLVKVDMPGHAGSTTVVATLAEGALLLADAGGRADYLGYSMGARFCLSLALVRPELIDRLVLISGTAGIDDPDERRARRLADQALAEELDPADPAKAALPVETFVRRWLDGPMFAGIDDRANGFTERLRNRGPGLASSLRLAGTGTQPPQWAHLGDLAMPVLVVTGGRDEKFTALGRRLVAAIGSNATHAVVAGAGHAPHLQQPDEAAVLVREHLERSG